MKGREHPPLPSEISQGGPEDKTIALLRKSDTDVWGVRIGWWAQCLSLVSKLVEGWPHRGRIPVS